MKKTYQRRPSGYWDGHNFQEFGGRYGGKNSCQPDEMMFTGEPAVVTHPDGTITTAKVVIITKAQKNKDNTDEHSTDQNPTTDD